MTDAMYARADNVRALANADFDVLIIGGGINGAVAAAALSARGVATALIDQGDFAGHTSMQSSNLVWGGIKYMENWDFRLVRKLCLSRNHLLDNYPSTVREIRFLATIRTDSSYPRWVLYLGTWLYWLMGNGRTRPPAWLSRKKIRAEEPIVNLEESAGGFEYSDAYLFDNDARFVFNFVRGALDRGCTAANYVESLGGRRSGEHWAIRARDVTDDSEFEIRARVLINAAGPFVDAHNALTGISTRHRHVFSKGIHLIVDRLTENRRVLTFLADDDRPFFVIPMGARTMIGTTDTPVTDPQVQVTDGDIEFVLDNINKRLCRDKPLCRADIISTRCGVRPLAVTAGADHERDFLQLSRKHAIDIDADRAHLSIFGGKLTDCVNVGDEVCAAVRDLGLTVHDDPAHWYGEPPEAARQDFHRRAAAMNLDALTPPGSSAKLSARLWRRYGNDAVGLLELIAADPRQAEPVIEGAEHIRCEVQHARQYEMITKLEDYLRRRSKIALELRRGQLRREPGLMRACEILFGDQARERFDEYFDAAPDTGEAGTPSSTPDGAQ